MQTKTQPSTEPTSFHQELARQALRAHALTCRDREQSYRQQRRAGLSPAIIDVLFRDPPAGAQA